LPEEIFDVCDANDRVIGQAPRSDVHARRLLHRAVHIFVLNTRGELLIHKRSATKDEYPLCYTSSASGHLGAGETYDEAAPRELEEELGLTTPIEYLASFRGGPELAMEHTALYRTVTDAPLHPDPGEIAEVEFLPVDAIVERVRATPDCFTPPFRVLLAWYAENCQRGAP